MGFTGTYLWRLRQKVGHDLLLCPGSTVVVEQSDGAILLMERQDNSLWSLVGGAASDGDSYITAALRELHEETGIKAKVQQLIPYGCVSDPSIYTLHYPSGDQVQMFAMCFILRDYQLPVHGHVDESEVKQLQFFSLTNLPPMHPATSLEIALYQDFLKTGQFQVR